ncbi:hypothetical protein APY03_1652 [Variovorax sp. WDL1]|nr:hypothetical protein APY03_1652 [Variovorax sp. WDL1]
MSPFHGSSPVRKHGFARAHSPRLRSVKKMPIALHRIVRHWHAPALRIGESTAPQSMTAKLTSGELLAL